MKPSAPVIKTVLGDIPLLKAAEHKTTNLMGNFTASSLIHGNQAHIYAAEVNYL
jgi:hypothetical protein